MVAVWSAGSAWAATINTHITSRYEIVEQGVRVRIRIANQGTSKAYDLKATLRLGKRPRKWDALGNNDPGGTIDLTAEYRAADLRPGLYIGVVRVDFEDRMGRGHHTYHFFQLPYGLARRSLASPALAVEPGRVSFNPKAFWKKRATLPITLKNTSSHPLRGVLRVFVPEGFEAEKGEFAFTLGGGEKKRLRGGLLKKGRARTANVYHVLAAFEQEGIERTVRVQGAIRVKEEPVLFRGYLGLAGLVLLVVLGICLRSPLKGRGSSASLLALLALFLLACFSGPIKPGWAAQGSSDEIIVGGIHFRTDAKGREQVLIQLNRVYVPEIITLTGERPRVVIDIIPVFSWEKTSPLVVNGHFIKKVRTHLHYETDTLRIVIDLQPGLDYRVDPIFYEAETLFAITVSELKNRDVH